MIIWKDIPYHTGYQLGSNGEIRKVSRFDEYGNIILGESSGKKWGKIKIVDDNGINVLVDVKRLYKHLFENDKNKKKLR